MVALNNNVRVGRTISGDFERQESESERLAARKKIKAKKIIRVVTLLVMIASIAVVVIMEVSVWLSNRAEEEKAAKVLTPTIEVIDESNTGITSRMREYVAQVEQDLKELGLVANRAVVPAGKMREVHLFLNGYDCYVKMNIDRGSAVSTEDTKRMLAYVTENNLHPEYIDVRVKGKGYLK